MGQVPDVSGAEARDAGAEAAAPSRPRRESGRARQRRQERSEADGSPLYRLKVEGAQVLGLWDKVQRVGWGGLSAAESGRVGGYMTRMLRLRRSEADGPAGADRAATPGP